MPGSMHRVFCTSTGKRDTYVGPVERGASVAVTFGRSSRAAEANDMPVPPIQWGRSDFTTESKDTQVLS